MCYEIFPQRKWFVTWNQNLLIVTMLYHAVLLLSLLLLLLMLMIMIVVVVFENRLCQNDGSLVCITFFAILIMIKVVFIDQYTSPKQARGALQIILLITKTVIRTN